jgi:hypothetical protein
VAAGLGFIPEIGLENPRGADREEIFVGDRLGNDPSALDQRLRIVARTERMPMRFPAGVRR